MGCQAIVTGRGGLSWVLMHSGLLEQRRETPWWPTGESEVQYPAGGWCLEKKLMCEKEEEGTLKVPPPLQCRKY